MIITKTPYRLSLFGGGTDYNAWYEKHSGRVLAAAINHYCYLSVRVLPPFFEHRYRVAYSRVEQANQVSEILHPAVRACLQEFEIGEGLEIHHDGDLPARSGIGSSSSFTVGLLHALHALKRQMISANSLASQAIHVEQNVLGEAVGIQDQIMAAYGGLRIIEMGPTRNWSVSQLTLPSDYLQAFEQHILMGFSGINRFSNSYAQENIANIRDNKHFEELEAISQLAETAITAFSSSADFKVIGDLLHEGWQLKRRLFDRASADWMDDLYSIAIASGAFGGKLMGAGGGGFFYFMAPPSRHDAIKKSLSTVKVWVPFTIAKSGSQVVFLD